MFSLLLILILTSVTIAFPSFFVSKETKIISSVFSFTDTYPDLCNYCIFPFLQAKKLTNLSIYNYVVFEGRKERKEMFYLTTHSTHFIYVYMASDIW